MYVYVSNVFQVNYLIAKVKKEQAVREQAYADFVAMGKEFGAVASAGLKSVHALNRVKYQLGQCFEHAMRQEALISTGSGRPTLIYPSTNKRPWVPVVHSATDAAGVWPRVVAPRRAPGGPSEATAREGPPPP